MKKYRIDPPLYTKEVDREEYVIPEPTKEEYKGKRKPKSKKDWDRKDHELDNWN